MHTGDAGKKGEKENVWGLRLSISRMWGDDFIVLELHEISPAVH